MTTRRRAKSSEREQRSKPVTVSAMTENQKEYIISMIENDIVFCVGPSGSGKSFIASGIAADKLYKEEIDQIIVTRPLVCSGSDIGALPGDVREKVAPYLAPMEENLKYFLKSYYGLFFNDRKIRYEPLELMRGATFHNSYMILDEAQNCSADQIKMFITRMGENSKVLINGDTNQTDIHGQSGLAYTINKLRNVKGVGSVKLTYEDIQRNGIIGRVLSALEGDPSYNNEDENKKVPPVKYFDEWEDEDDYDEYGE